MKRTKKDTTIVDGLQWLSHIFHYLEYGSHVLTTTTLEIPNRSQTSKKKIKKKKLNL